MREWVNAFLHILVFCLVVYAAIQLQPNSQGRQCHGVLDKVSVVPSDTGNTMLGAVKLDIGKVVKVPLGRSLPYGLGVGDRVTLWEAKGRIGNVYRLVSWE